jgi:Anti-sigma-K factor rskA
VNEDELAMLLESAGAERRDDAAGREGRGTAARVRGLLADDAVWAEPPPSGIDDLLAAIAAESESGGGAPAPAAPREWGARGAPESTRPGMPAESRPPTAPTQPGVSTLPGAPAHRATRRPARRRLALVAAAAMVAVAAGAAGFIARGASDDGGGREVEVAGTELAPDASAVARVEETGSGVAIELDVRDLPPAEPGTYYQAWLKGPDGLVTVGTFHMQDGDDTVELWSGVPLDRYPTLTVTLQQEGAGQESSGQVVLTAEIGP